MCKHSQKKLSAYPFVLILYVEKNTQNGENEKQNLSNYCDENTQFTCKASHVVSVYKDMYDLPIIIALSVLGVTGEYE